MILFKSVVDPPALEIISPINNPNGEALYIPIKIFVATPVVI